MKSAAFAKDALQAYAKFSCRALSDQVYAAFSREIRDLIYGYLLPYSTDNMASFKTLSELYIGDDHIRTPNTSISLKEPGYFGIDDQRDLRCPFTHEEVVLRRSQLV